MNKPIASTPSVIKSPTPTLKTTSGYSPDTKSKKQPLWSSSLIDTVGIVLKVPHAELATYAEGNSAVNLRGPWKIIVNSPIAAGVNAIVRSRKGRTELYIEGSISKFLTGQNLIGLESLEKAVPMFVRTVLQQVGIRVTRRISDTLDTGKYRLARIDFAVHCTPRDENQAIALMAALKTLVFQRARDASFYGNDTIYIGQHSSRRTLRIYRKDLEMALPGRSLAADHQLGSKVLENLPGLIRIELVLRFAELKRHGWDIPGVASPALLRRLMTRWIDRFAKVDGCIVNPDLVSKLTASDQTKLAAWALGDVLAFDRSPSTKAKTCRRILRTTGVDVRHPLSPEAQRRAVIALQTLFVDNVGFKAHRRAWLEMVKQYGRRECQAVRS